MKTPFNNNLSSHTSLVGVLLLGWLLFDDFHHLLLDLLLLQHQSVLVPDEVGSLQVESVSLHARLEQPDDVRIVGVLSEGEASAVVHKLSEFLRLVFAQFLDGDFLLLLLDVIVLLLLGSSWQSLPRK